MQPQQCAIRPSKQTVAYPAHEGGTANERAGFTGVEDASRPACYLHDELYQLSFE